MNHTVQAVDNSRKQAIRWLREVLAAIVDNAVLPQRIKQKAASLIRRLPDWYLSRWATALNIDFMKGYGEYPDLAGKAGSDEGKDFIQRYLDENNVAVMMESLKKLVKELVRLNNEGRLPGDANTVERQVCALALAACTEEGKEFTDSMQPWFPLDEYRATLEAGDREKTVGLDAILNGHSYGEWVTQRIEEVKRWLGVDEPVVIIKHGPRTPLWESFWREFFTGGANGTNNS